MYHADDLSFEFIILDGLVFRFQCMILFVFKSWKSKGYLMAILERKNSLNYHVLHEATNDDNSVVTLTPCESSSSSTVVLKAPQAVMVHHRHR